MNTAIAKFQKSFGSKSNTKTFRNIVIAIFVLVVFYSSIKRLIIAVKEIIKSATGLFIDENRMKIEEHGKEWAENIRVNYGTADIKNMSPVEKEAFLNCKLAADRLYRAFEHSGTDEKTVMGILFELGSVDLANIIYHYGVRTTHVFFFDDVTGTLTDHIMSELSSSYVNELHDTFIRVGIDMSYGG